MKLKQLFHYGAIYRVYRNGSHKRYGFEGFPVQKGGRWRFYSAAYGRLTFTDEQLWGMVMGGKIETEEGEDLRNLVPQPAGDNSTKKTTGRALQKKEKISPVLLEKGGWYKLRHEGLWQWVKYKTYNTGRYSRHVFTGVNGLQLKFADDVIRTKLKEQHLVRSSEEEYSTANQAPKQVQEVKEERIEEKVARKIEEEKASDSGEVLGALTSYPKRINEYLQHHRDALYGGSKKGLDLTVSTTKIDYLEKLHADTIRRVRSSDSEQRALEVLVERVGHAISLLVHFADKYWQANQVATLENSLKITALREFAEKLLDEVSRIKGGKLEGAALIYQQILQTNE